MKPTSPGEAERAVVESEDRAPVWMETMLAWGAVAPLAVGGILAWLTTGTARAVDMSLTIVWGGAILVFEAGVARGLRLAARGAPSAPPMALFLWLFALAAASMVSLEPLTSLGLLLVGYVTLAVMARRTPAPAGAAPGFTRLARWLPAIAGLAAVAGRLLQKR